MSPITGSQTTIPKSSFDALPVGLGMAYGAMWPIVTSLLGVKDFGAFTNAISLSYMLSKFYFGNELPIKPAAVIGGIPLGSVAELSHGISDREVKYRANGGIFLAHQHGGNESLRIVGKAWGPNRFLFLNALDLLFSLGKVKYVDILSESLQPNAWNSPSVVNYDDSLDQMTQIADITENPWENWNRGVKSKETYEETHITFPVITKNRVYLSMFIETYSWRQSVDRTGQRCVEYTIFFRTYKAPPNYEYALVTFPAKDADSSPTFIRAYREEKRRSSLLYSSLKFAAEIIPTMTLYFMADDPDGQALVQFFGQMNRNYQGIDTLEHGRIPGIIEQRFFG